MHRAAVRREAGTGSSRRSTTGSGVFIVGLIAAIGIFLIWQAVPALSSEPGQLPHQPRVGHSRTSNAMAFGVLDLLLVTVLVSLFALVLAMPVALGIALFLTAVLRRSWLTGRWRT